jgi:hypothetical protein
MLAWLADNAGVLSLLLGLIALGLVAGWWMTRRAKLLLGLVPITLLALGVWLIARFTDTDKKRLERIVQEMAQGVREGNAQRILAHISSSFTFRSMQVGQFREYVERQLRNRRARDVTVSKFSFEEVSRSAGKAKIEFWAHTEEAHGLPIRCEADFLLESGRWKMSAFQIFQGNTRNTWPIP